MKLRLTRKCPRYSTGSEDEEETIFPFSKKIILRICFFRIWRVPVLEFACRNCNRSANGMVRRFPERLIYCPPREFYRETKSSFRTIPLKLMIDHRDAGIQPRNLSVPALR